jgi:hypothetical protein
VIGRLLCRLGLHRYEWRNQVVGDLKTKTAYTVTRYRCRRETCPGHLWWHTADFEKLNIPYEEEVPHGD